MTHSLPNWTMTGPPLSPGAVVASNSSGVALLPKIWFAPLVPLSKSVEMILLPARSGGLPYTSMMFSPPQRKPSALNPCPLLPSPFHPYPSVAQTMPSRSSVSSISRMGSAMLAGTGDVSVRMDTSPPSSSEPPPSGRLDD